MQKGYEKGRKTDQAKSVTDLIAPNVWSTRTVLERTDSLSPVPVCAIESTLKVGTSREAEEFLQIMLDGVTGYKNVHQKSGDSVGRDTDSAQRYTRHYHIPA